MDMKRRIAMSNLRDANEKQGNIIALWKVTVGPQWEWSDKINKGIFGKDGPDYGLVEATSADEATKIFASEHSLDPAYFQAVAF